MRAPQVVITRVQGKTTGGGVGLVAASDYALAVTGASLKLSELAVGLGPFVIGPPYVPQQMIDRQQTRQETLVGGDAELMMLPGYGRLGVLSRLPRMLAVQADGTSITTVEGLAAVWAGATEWTGRATSYTGASSASLP